MTRRSSLLVTTIAGVVFSTIVVAPSPIVARQAVYKSSIELVPLTVTVTDGAGRYVANLAAADFAVFEEGKPQVVSHFAAGHAPVDVGFLIDTSGSMSDKLLVAQKAAGGLVRQLKQGDRAAVGGIASTVSVQQSMTPDLARVEAALKSTSANGETALYDAVYIALRQYQKERSPDVRRQVLVLLSDGVDTASHVTFEDVLDLVRRTEVTIYVVSLAEEPSGVQDVRAQRTLFESVHALSTLARESGGRMFRPRTTRDLVTIYDAVGEELSNQYLLGYVPAGRVADGTFRHVAVGVLEPRVGMARTRVGYYADPRR